MTDWADDLAKELFALSMRAAGRPTTVQLATRDVIAARLRIVRCEGVGEGMDRSSLAIDEVFERHKKSVTA